MSLPKELNLGSNKPMSSNARPQILRFRSDNSTYTAGDTIRIEIPTGRVGQYAFPLDSFLEFKLKINASGGAAAGTTNFFLDQSIYSLFNRIRVLQGSVVLEDTLYCNRLWTALYDIQVNESERRGDTITKGIYDMNATSSTASFNSGLFGQLLAIRTSASAASDSSLYDFSFVIPSALFGSLSQKALPLSLLGASSLYIEFELAPINVAFVQQLSVSTANGTLNSYTVSDIYYNTKVSILPLEIEQALIQSTGGIINLPAVAYKVEQKAISAASTVFNDKFSFQYSSLKNFIFWITNQTTANGDISKRSISSRPKANINDFYLNINGELYPTQTITGYCRHYQELLRAYDGLTDTNFGGILSFYNYSYDSALTGTDIIETAADTTWTTSTKQKRWIGGIDLDRFNHSSDTLMSGTSTIGQMLSLVVNMSSGTAEGLNLYGAVMYDVLFHIENGQLTAKF
jgi:hypothetical protein